MTNNVTTISFNATFGLVPGYNHRNNTEEDLQSFGTIWQINMQNVFEKTGVLVSGVVTNSNTVYPVEFGCPLGGEKTVTVTGHLNPNFGFTKIEDYKKSVIEVCERVKADLKQTTLSISFSLVEHFVYLSDKNPVGE